MRSLMFIPLLVACADDHPTNDAALLPGDYSCINAPWPMTAPDPLIVAGSAIDLDGARLGGVTVEIRSVADNALLGGTTTTTDGNYSTSVATGGIAPTIDRHLSTSTYLDSY